VGVCAACTHFRGELRDQAGLADADGDLKVLNAELRETFTTSS
jgi:hypothetical protein